MTVSEKWQQGRTDGDVVTAEQPVLTRHTQCHDEQRRFTCSSYSYCTVHTGTILLSEQGCNYAYTSAVAQQQVCQKNLCKTDLAKNLLYAIAAKSGANNLYTQLNVLCCTLRHLREMKLCDTQLLDSTELPVHDHAKHSQTTVQ